MANQSSVVFSSAVSLDGIVIHRYIQTVVLGRDPLRAASLPAVWRWSPERVSAALAWLFETGVIDASLLIAVVADYLQVQPDIDEPLSKYSH